MSWPSGRDSKRAKDQFAEEMVATLEQMLGVKATRTKEFALEFVAPDGTPITMYLHNSFLDAQRLTGRARQESIRNAVLASVPPPQPETWAEAAPKLMPAVRAISFVNAQSAIFRPLAPFVTVTCAIDSEFALTTVTPEHVERWGVSADEAFAAASANLAQRGLQAKREGPITVALGPEGYASSWLAAPVILGRLARELGKEVIAIAPSRDQLALVDASDADATIRLIEDACTDYGQMPRRLSPVPYRVSASGIEVWDPPKNHAARTVVRKAQGLLANNEYALQRTALQKHFAESGEDVFVAGYSMAGRSDGSVFSWAVWVKQVSDGLVPQADYLAFVDTDTSDQFAVRWLDALEIAGDSLKCEPGLDPPRWRHGEWPNPDKLGALRNAAAPFPPPAGG
jgi:hypothetical protein